jgi:hypothetical protein
VKGRLALAAWLSLAGCASTQTPGPQRLGPTLQGTVTAVEITADGKRLPIPADGVTDVDINSTIDLTTNTAEVATAAGKVAGGGTGKSASVDFAAQMRAMDDVTTAEQASTKLLQQLVARLSAGHAPSPDELKQLGKAERGVVDAVGKYAVIAGMDRETRSSLFSKPGYTALVPWINPERSRLLALMQGQLEQLPNLRWRLEASSSRAGAIHLPNYDDLPEGASVFVNKIALQVDDQTRKNLAAATDLADNVNKLIDQQGSLSAAFQQMAVEKARQAAAAWEDWAKQDLTTIEALVAKLKKSLAADADVQVVVTNAGALIDEGKALKGACAGVLSTLQTIIDTRSLSGDLGALGGCATAVRDTLPKLRDQATKAEEAAQKLLTRAQAAAGPALDAIKQQAAALQTVVHAKESLDHLQEAWTTFAGVLDVKPAVPPPAWRNDHFQDRPLDSTLETAIDLTKTNPRQDGDAIFFRPSLTKDGTRLLTGRDKALRVRKEGARVDVSAAITFVRPTSLRDGEDPFRAAPGLTAALHYRDWRDPGHNAGNRLWNFLDPGIGFHVIYPDLGQTQLDANGKVISKDPSAEIGVGGVVQLLGDLFQAGYGYDIQVARPYWYIGFGLQRLIDLGITLPVSGGRSPANQ